MTTAQQSYNEIHADLGLLNNDLQVRRGGNKARLVARIYAAIRNAPGNNDHLETYEQFREVRIKWTFEKLHKVYDHMLPQEHRSKVPGIGGAAPRKAKQANGMTEAQQAKFDRFCKAPARLEKRFLKTADHFKGCIDFYGHTDQLQASVDNYERAARFCASLIGNAEDLAGFWGLGMRTGGDLESWIERALRA